MATIKNSFLNILIKTKKYNYYDCIKSHIYIYLYFILCKSVGSGLIYVLAQIVVFVWLIGH